MQTDGWAIRPDFLGRHVRGGRSNRTSKRVPARELARARGQGAADPGRRGFPSNSLRRIAIHTSLDHSASIGTTTRCGPRSAPKCGFSTSGCASLSSACRGRYKVFLDSRADAAGPGGAAPDCQPSLRRQLCGLVVRPGRRSALPRRRWHGSEVTADARWTAAASPVGELPASARRWRTSLVRADRATTGERKHARWRTGRLSPPPPVLEYRLALCPKRSSPSVLKLVVRRRLERPGRGRAPLAPGRRLSATRRAWITVDGAGSDDSV